MVENTYSERVAQLVDDIIYHYESATAIGKVLGYLHSNYRGHVNYSQAEHVLRQLQKKEWSSAERKCALLLDNEFDVPPYENRWEDLKPQTPD